jgi:DNA mismatch endonuclease (patch repair protein)
MSRIRAFDSGPEVAVRARLDALGISYEKNVHSLLGRPDIVFRAVRLIVFIDGDFWHGYRFPCWQARLSAYWQRKIIRNRERDRRNHRTLRRQGWHVIRIWSHQVERDLDQCITTIRFGLTKQHKSRGESKVLAGRETRPR